MAAPVAPRFVNEAATASLATHAIAGAAEYCGRPIPYDTRSAPHDLASGHATRPEGMIVLSNRDKRFNVDSFLTLSVRLNAERRP